jgi:hypothetical protein
VTLPASSAPAKQPPYFECAAYAAVRQPLTDAATEWCKLSAEHTPEMGGFRQALLVRIRVLNRISSKKNFLPRRFLA